MPNNLTNISNEHIIISGIIIYFIAFIVLLFFCISLYSAIKQVPKDKRVFPIWFCWLILIPIVGYVFQWIMLPFGIPKTFQKYFPDNREAQKRADSLFSIGLARLILQLLCIIPILNILFVIPALVFFIIYWVKVVAFKKKFLLNK